MNSKLSVFMVTHNCINRGEPFVESILQLHKFIEDIVVVDLWSNDGTDKILRQLPCKLVFSTLENPYSLFRTQCNNDLVLMVDPNEIFDYSLLRELIDFIDFYNNRKNTTFPKNISIPRIEISCNFQKISCNVHDVHRVFPRNSKSLKRVGVSTNKIKLKKMFNFGNDYGLLWAITNNFRDNWYNTAKMKDISYLPPNHYLGQVSMNKSEIEVCKIDRSWKSIKTPLQIPDCLMNLVGDVEYNPMKNLRKIQ